MHSLEPYDIVIVKIGTKFKCSSCCIESDVGHDASVLGPLTTHQSQLRIMDHVDKSRSPSEANLMHIYDNVGYINWNGDIKIDPGESTDL